MSRASHLRRHNCKRQEKDMPSINLGTTTKAVETAIKATLKKHQKSLLNKFDVFFVSHVNRKANFLLSVFRKNAQVFNSCSAEDDVIDNHA